MFLPIILAVVHATASQAWPASNYSKSPESYGLGALDDEVDWPRHPCKRECRDDDEPLTCRYGFTVEDYASMSSACYDCPRNVTDCFRPHCIPADGSITRTLIVANRQLPGPSIEVCKRDRIIVDVSNRLMDEATSIHWHGVHQRGTPFMDGVPMVSQCPIITGDGFRYDFVAAKAGTYFWHGHSGIQRGDGLFGALIVREPVAKLYDRDEHVIMLNEWSDVDGHRSFTLLFHAMSPATQPHTIMINGFGPYGDQPRTAHIPRPVFHVEKGTRHRFRMIHAGADDCPMSITVDGHPLLVLSSDGADVRPVKVDGIRMSPGERYDFVLTADREVGNYWIRVLGDDVCKAKQVHQTAILRYGGAAEVEPSENVGYGVGFEADKRILNPSNRGSEVKNGTCVPCLLRSIDDNDDGLLGSTPDQQLYLNFDGLVVDSNDYHRKGLYGVSQVSRKRPSMLINNLAFKAPDFPLQTQPELIGPNYLCNVSEAKCTREQCRCPHVLQLKLNSNVELVLVDETRRMSRGPNGAVANHPVHLHGYHFRVLAMERLNYTTTVQQVRELDRAGKVRRLTEAAPWKDVINVPSGGYTIVRLRADNPGYWFLHCHVDWHTVNGMAMVLKVGEKEDFPAVPKDFPKCLHQPNPSQDREISLTNSSRQGQISPSVSMI